MFPNHRYHPCVKWVSHRWRSHYLWSVRVSQHFGDHPHRSQRLRNIPPLLRAFACRAYRASDSISNGSSFDARCETILPFLVGHRGMDSWLHRTAVDELFSLGFTPRVVLSCLSVRNEMTIVVQLLWCYHAALASLPTAVTLWGVDGVKSRPDSKDADSRALPLGDYSTFALASGHSHRHFSSELLGGQHWACWGLDHASCKTAWSKDLHPKIQTFWCQGWTILCPSLK